MRHFVVDRFVDVEQSYRGTLLGMRHGLDLVRLLREVADDEGDIARRYQRDGGYVPRTFFLAPDGTLDPDIHAARPKFQYFFDEQNPASILAGMDEAVRKLRR